MTESVRRRPRRRQPVWTARERVAIVSLEARLDDVRAVIERQGAPAASARRATVTALAEHLGRELALAAIEEGARIGDRLAIERALVDASAAVESAAVRALERAEDWLAAGDGPALIAGARRAAAGSGAAVPAPRRDPKALRRAPDGKP